MKAIIFPGKYYQGAGIISRVAKIADSYGAKKPMMRQLLHVRYGTMRKVFMWDLIYGQ